MILLYKTNIYLNEILFNQVDNFKFNLCHNFSEVINYNYNLLIFEDDDFSPFKDLNITKPIIIITNQPLLANLEEKLYIHKLNKPINLHLLISLINKIIINIENKIIKIDKNITINLTFRNIYFDNISVNLTDKEADLIEYLYRQNNFVSKEQLLKDLWNYQDNIDSHTIETHIYNLRQKLGNKDFIISNEKGYYLSKNNYSQKQKLIL